MTHEEFVMRSAALKEAIEGETKTLEADLIRARAKVERLEARLHGIREQYQRRSTALMNAYMGIADEPVIEDDGGDNAADRKKRGILDGPLLELARSIAAPDVTAGQLEAVWNSRNPGTLLTSSTVRGVLDRLSAKGSLIITDPGGGRGSGIPRKYRPAMGESD